LAAIIEAEQLINLNMVLRNAFKDMDKMPSGHVSLEHLKLQVLPEVACMFHGTRPCTHVHLCAPGAGGAPRQAQVLLAGRGAPAGIHSCRQE